jgi:hypothetical protein
LNIIYGAIQEYQKRKQGLPRWLSDLAPDFIHNSDLLYCSYVLKTGNAIEWKKGLLDQVFRDPNSSYGFELCNEPLAKPSNKTYRDYKQYQMEVVGFAVPIVRCLAHRPALNLAFDGSIYESDKEWEDIFLDLVKSQAHVRTNAYRRFFHRTPLVSGRSAKEEVFRLIQPRDPGASPRMLDLSKQYNASLLHLSQIDFAGKLLGGYPEGIHKVGDLEFDIRGLVHLGARNLSIPFPEKVEDIEVNQKCSRIHFLHGAIFSATRDSKIASCLIRFDDGRTNQLPIVYGKDVNTRWFDSRRESELENPKVAWTSPPDQVGPAGKSLRLYQTTWTNQQPDVEVKSITFVSHMTESAPFLLAITLE